MSQDIVIFSLFQWSSNLMHRDHMLAKSFNKLGYNVTFVERAYIKPTQILKPVFSSRTDCGIRIITLPSLPYIKGRMSVIYEINDKILSRGIREISDLVDSKAWLITSTPNWGRAILANKKKTQILAYDMSDDLPDFATNEKWKKQLENRENEILEKSDIIFVTAKNLLEKTKAYKKVHLVENGVDIDDFKKATPVLREQFKGLIAGYIGGIYKWVDLDLIQETASLNPETDFVLVGPTNRKPEINEIAKLNNIHYLGEVKWQEIGDYFASLDLGLIPFVSEEKYPRLKTANSNKVFQYAYFGYPIVSTDFVQVRDLDGIVTVCKNEGDFIHSFKEALKRQDYKDKNKRIAYAKSHSWNIQAEKIIRAIFELST